MNEQSLKDKEEIRRILTGLSAEETAALKKVLQLERDNLYLSAPHVKQDLLKIIRETIK